MISIDFDILARNLSRIPKDEEFDPDEGTELKKLFLVLAGDQRVISRLSLEDMAELFNSAPRLLGHYSDSLEYQFNEPELENYAGVMRRAI